MTKKTPVFSGSISEVGKRNSLLAPSFVGFMRRLGMTAAITAGTAVLGAGYARWEAQRPILREAEIELLPRPGFKTMRILHVSDLHMFPGQDFIKEFLEKVTAEHEIDFVISTGDNLGATDSIDELLEAYEPLLAYPGAFVLGSNDYYSPETRNWFNYLQPNRGEKAVKRHRRNQPDLPWLELVNHLTEAGWIDLSNRGETIEVPTPAGSQKVSLIGVDDPHIKRDRMPTPPKEWNDPDALRIGLTHAPYQRVLDSFAADNADLAFAGHTHGGQVRIPLAGAVVTNCDLPRRYSRGVHFWWAKDPEKLGTFINVSAGLGTSPFAPIRFACRPEASLLEITVEEESAEDFSYLGQTIDPQSGHGTGCCGRGRNGGGHGGRNGGRNGSGGCCGGHNHHGDITSPTNIESTESEPDE